MKWRLQMELSEGLGGEAAVRKTGERKGGSARKAAKRFGAQGIDTQRRGRQ